LNEKKRVEDFFDIEHCIAMKNNKLTQLYLTGDRAKVQVEKKMWQQLIQKTSLED
jgi:hypothetical protein